ncbi:YcjX family protein [Roseomonas elaeocarpi]|uniref:YcjX family protein n=1 Tax=Roseomonas elaeocarpi TaxID=907779 RepID=A0ABV6JYK0_9PROT
MSTLVSVAEAPFRLMRDVLAGAEDAALAVAGRERIRLAVTGLSRAGKTVFITSLVANLLAAGGKARTLPLLSEATAGRLVDVRLVPADVETTPRFDALGHLQSLAADPAEWPARTEDLATLSLQLTLRRRDLWGQVLPDRQVTLELLDYPGEWLLDLPMLGGDYAGWSAATLRRLRAIDAEPVAEFLRFAEALPPASPGDEALVRRGWTLYRDALRHCRDALGLRFLQPGRVLNPGPRGEMPLLWFFPTPPVAEGGALFVLMERRHDAYLADQRDTFFTPVFNRFDRQVVLVDVLGALHAGERAFDDTAEALGSIAASLRYGSSWLDRFTRRGVSRVAFAATKADHVPDASRPALRSLLEDLLGESRTRIMGGGAELSVHEIAAIRCTEDTVVQRDGRTVPAVRGVMLDSGRWARIDPGTVPATRPGPGYWRLPYFAMPVFQPPRLAAEGLSGVPHLGLDGLLNALIGDLL